MKAVQINEYGHSDKLKSVEVPIPQIKDDEVLVKIHDAGINPADWKIREGYMKAVSPASFPLGMGQDFAGEVLDVGSNVKKFKRGDRVFGFARGSAYAEMAAVPQDKIAIMPEKADFIHASALPTAGLTAYQIVMDEIKIQPDQKILVHGAAGGVGSYLVQIAIHEKAFVIANAAGEDAEYLKNLGVQQVIDFKTQRFEEFVKDADAVVDLVGGEVAERSYQVLKKGGVLLSTVGAAKEEEGQKYGVRTISFLMKPNGDELQKLAELYDSGDLEPRIDRVVPFEDYRIAQDLVQSGQAHGKIVMQIPQ
jgi:NADPH:quinone reductase-like Zn-dependent oxidoreductase